jgi:hypothetical protein
MLLSIRKITNIILLAVMLFTSCLSESDHSNTSIKSSDDDFDYYYLTKYILNYYEKESKSDTSENSDEITYETKIEENDCCIEFSEGIVDKKGGIDFGVVSWNSIPKPTGFVYGDINNDSETDVIVSVLSSSGGSWTRNEIFVFLNANDTLIFDGKYFDVDLVDSSLVNDEMEFHAYAPGEIKNGLVFGGIYFRAGADPACCPSISFTTQHSYTTKKGFKLINKQLTKQN